MPSAALRLLVVLAYALPVLAADQALKAWVVRNPVLQDGSIPLVPGWFALTVTHNYGAAWSLLLGQKWLLLTVSCVASVAIVWYTMAEPRARMALAGLGFLLGGTVGNLLDRARLGYVVDMFDLQYGGRNIFPIFNVADVCIDIGIGLLILHSILEGRRERRAREAEAARPAPETPPGTRATPPEAAPAPTDPSAEDPRPA